MGWALNSSADAFMKGKEKTHRKIAREDLESQRMWWSQN